MTGLVKVIDNKNVRIFSSEDLSHHDSILSRHDVEMDRRAIAAVQAAINRAKICQKPIARYDVLNKRAYIEYADGKIQYVY